MAETTPKRHGTAVPRAEDTLMHAEAGEAAAAVERQLALNDGLVESLAAQLRREPPRFVVTCARGSSGHAATWAKYAVETQLGLVVATASPSVASLYDARQDLSGALFVVISQSGRSPDLLKSAEVARARGARVVALMNVADAPLAERADVVIPLHAGAERSVAATKSYLATLAALLHLVARWRDDPGLLTALRALPAGLRAAAALDWSPLVDGLADADDLFVLGRGYGLGAAAEVALKFKETCGLHAEAFSSAEVKHGPMALIGPDFPLLMFGQDDATLAGTLDAAREFQARGARVWCAAPGAPTDIALPVVPSAHPLCAPILAVQSFYRAANALAVRRGFDPDLPPHLNKVTETV